MYPKTQSENFLEDNVVYNLLKNVKPNQKSFRWGWEYEAIDGGVEGARETYAVCRPQKC